MATYASSNNNNRITIVSCQTKIMGNLCARGHFMLPLTNSLMNLSSIVVHLLYLGVETKLNENSLQSNYFSHLSLKQFICKKFESLRQM